MKTFQTRAWLVPAAVLAAACGLLADKKPEEMPPAQKEVVQSRATNWDEKIGTSTFEAHADRIGAASIDTLAMAGPDAAPKVADHLSDPSPGVRNKAVETLAKFGREAEGAVPKILMLLQNADPNLRSAAAKALALIGSQTGKSHLSQAQKDPDPRVRAWAHAGLAKLEGNCEDHMLELAKILKSGQGPELSEAVEALGFADCADDDVIETLIAALSGGDEEVRAAAARAIGQIGERASAAVPALTKALKGNSWRVRQAALLALAKLGSQAAPSVPLITNFLKDPAPRFRELAAHALGSIGPPASSAVGELQKATQDQEATVQAAARRALANILDSEQPDTRKSE